MADISRVTIPNISGSGSTTYDIKDATAREQIAAITGGYTKFLGVTTTPLEDGDTTNPITINGQSVTAGNGDIVTYNNKEFIFNGNTGIEAWQELGDLSALGEMAFADTASGSFTPQGSISGSFSGTSTTSTGKFTPSGSITGTSFTGASMTSTGTFTASGTVSKPTVTPTSTTVNAVDTTGIATAVTGFNDSTNQVSGSSVTPVYITGVTGETLQFSLANPVTQAAVATEAKTVLTAVDVAAPSFTGTTDQTVSVTGTTTGSVTNGTFTGPEDDVTVSGTPSGSISATFTGTAGTITVSPDSV